MRVRQIIMATIWRKMESEQLWRRESAAEKKAEHLKVMMRASADCWVGFSP